MIFCYIEPDHKNWDVILPFVTYAYNAAVQQITGLSAFLLVHGCPPSNVLDNSFLTAPVASASNSIDDFISRVSYSGHLARSSQDDSLTGRAQVKLRRFVPR